MGVSDLDERLRKGESHPYLDAILRRDARRRVKALEAALREIAELCEPSDCPDGALLTIDRISRFALGPKHYRAALAPEQDK